MLCWIRISFESKKEREMAIQVHHPYTNLKHEIQHLMPKPSSSPFTAYRSLLVRAKAGSGNAKQLIQSGKIRAIQPKEAASAMSSDGFILLDIRPSWETEKARVVESLHVPLFLRDTDNSPITLLKKWVHFGYIGLWTGQYFTTINGEFLEQVERAVPDKDSRVLVACGDGLRSMMAASKLHEGGYTNLGWLVGGFNCAKDGDFAAVEGPEKLQYAAIGGVSYIFLKLLILLQAVEK